MMVEATPIIHRPSSNCAGGSGYGDARLWLPIDAKFPHEDYEKPVDASERGDVWQVLAAVKTEFGKFGEVLDKVQQKLHEASSTIDMVSVRRRAIDRKLRGVEILPEMEAGAILSLPGGNGLEPEDSVDVESSRH